MRNQYLTQIELLRDRLWSRSLVEKYLPWPHRETRAFPMGVRGCTAYLYDIEQVKAIEMRIDVASRIAAIKRKRNPPKPRKPLGGIQLAVPTYESRGNLLVVAERA